MGRLVMGIRGIGMFFLLADALSCLCFCSKAFSQIILYHKYIRLLASMPIFRTHTHFAVERLKFPICQKGGRDGLLQHAHCPHACDRFDQ
jgi:hypothetical protein